jgi:hypothetical protein
MNPSIIYLVILPGFAILLGYCVIYVWKEYKKNSIHNFKNRQVLMNLPPNEIRHPWILIAILMLAIIAQALILGQMFAEGVFVYLLSITGFLLWARANPSSLKAVAESLHPNREGWLLLLGIVILLTISTRFFDLGSGIYGLDADETKWTVQAWKSKILHLDVTEFATKHYKYQPVDFWTKSIFLRIFGENFIAARMESAVLSLIAVVCLYGLAKQVTSHTAVGLISSLVFSLSFIELNASHQALYSTPPMAWMLSSLAVYFMAIHNHKLWQFQVGGILLGLGMLTYDTFYPTCVAAFVYLLAIAISEVWKGQTSIKNWGLYLTLFMWPTVLVYFTFIKNYLNQNRQFYLFGLLTRAVSKEDFYSLAQYFAGNFLDILEAVFSQIRWADGLINWNGPLINPLILPFVVIGLSYNLWNIRQAHFAFVPFLYLMHVGTGSILLGAVWPRVMYLSIPPLMIWAGLGLWIAFVSLRGIFRNQKVYVPVSIFALLLTAILANDYLIFKTKLIDRIEHQKRRELSDITIASAKGTSILLYPFMAEQKDFVEMDSHVIVYSLAGEKNMGMEAINHFGLVHMNTFLQSLWSNRNNGEIDVIFDKSAPGLMDERANFLNVVLFCYPQAQRSHQGRFFDVYRFSRQALNEPACYSPRKPVNISPAGDLAQTRTSPLSFKWNTGEIKSAGYIFMLDRKMADTFWIEAEQSFVGKGWLKESTVVPGYSAEGYLVDTGAEHTGEAFYTIDIKKPGNYYIWLRSYKRRDNDQHNFVTVQGTKTEIAKTGQPLNQWVWESIGMYNFPSEATTISLTREYGNDELYSTFIDAMVITANADFRPATEEEIWQTVFSVNHPESTTNSFVLDELLPVGSYRWGVRVFSSENIVDAHGNPWLESEKSTFQVVE